MTTHDPTTPPLPIRLFRRIRFRNGLRCPRCGHTRVHRWGSFGWRRRYRCLGCRRTFSDFTGTPLAYLKRVDRWPRFCRLAIRVTTVRRAARILGLDPRTSFRWRHRFLASMHRTETPELSGRTSVATGWLPYSEKGSRSLDRPPRRRAFDGLSFQTNPVWIVFACAETGRSMAAVCGRSFPTPVQLGRTLRPWVAADTVLVAERGREGAVAHAAAVADVRSERDSVPMWQHVQAWSRAGPARTEGAHQQGRLEQGRLEPSGLEPGRLHARRWKLWLRRFVGVATKYLANYLVWFRLLDLAAGRWVRPRSLAPILTGSFP